jgi:hypothetical protein
LLKILSHFFQEKRKLLQSENGVVKLNIYDLIGKEAALLVNESQEAG